MPASPPAPLALHHPTEKGPFFALLYTPPYRVSVYSLFLHSDYATISTLLCPHAASHLPPTKAPPYLGFFSTPFASPSQTSHPPLPSVCTWLLGSFTRTFRPFGFPHLFRIFPSVRIGSTIYFPLVCVLFLSGCFNHLK